MSYSNFTYSQQTKLLFGKNAEAATGRLLKEYGASRVLIVTGGSSSRKSGLLERLTDAITAENIGWTLYDHCRPNPETRWIDSGAQIYREEKCNFLLAVGGGSVIDAAKGIAMLTANSGGRIWDYMCNGTEFPNPGSPLGAVLTNAATGSECDASFVLSNDETREKLICTNETCLPRFAVCNPELTYSVGAWQTACGASDTLSHLLEQYFYTDNTCTASDEMLLGLMKTVVKWCPIALKEPDNYDARANLMLTSNLAMNGLMGVGHEQNWMTHMLEHAVSAVWNHVAHGAGMACLFPCYLETIIPQDSLGKIARFGAEVFGIALGKNAAEEAVSALRSFYLQLGMPNTLHGLVGHVPTKAELHVVAQKALPWGPAENGGYRQFGEKEVEELLTAAL